MALYHLEKFFKKAATYEAWKEEDADRVGAESYQFVMALVNELTGMAVVGTTEEMLLKRLNDLKTAGHLAELGKVLGNVGVYRVSSETKMGQFAQLLKEAGIFMVDPWNQTRLLEALQNDLGRVNKNHWQEGKLYHPKAVNNFDTLIIFVDFQKEKEVKAVRSFRDTIKKLQAELKVPELEFTILLVNTAVSTT